MSLRKSPSVTPEMHAARQASAQHSTGPRTPCGKEHSKMNAVQHGERSDPANHRLVMLALGEDPEDFEFLKKELMLCYGLGDTLFARQVDDLAKLYWRRGRAERAEEGLMRRSLLAAQERQRKRRREIEAASFDDPAALEVEVTLPDDPDARLRLLLSYLKIIRQQAERRVSTPGQGRVLRGCWEKQKTWRQARLCELLRADREREAIEREAPELLRLLEAEIASLEEQLKWAEELNAEKAAVERDACLAPQGEEWKLLLRREEVLDRAIDRKVRILLTMRHECRRPKKPADDYLMGTTPEERAEINRIVWGDDDDGIPPEYLFGDTLSEFPEPPPPAASPARRPAKSHERTENVYENKGPEAVEAADAAAQEQAPEDAVLDPRQAG